MIRKKEIKKTVMVSAKRMGVRSISVVCLYRLDVHYSDNQSIAALRFEPANTDLEVAIFTYPSTDADVVAISRCLPVSVRYLPLKSDQRLMRSK